MPTMTDRYTYELNPGDTVLVHGDPGEPCVWPALSPRVAREARVQEPALLHIEPSWYDDTVQLATLNTDLGPCRVSLTFRWLVQLAELQAA